MSIPDQIKFIESLRDNAGSDEAKAKFQAVIDSLRNYRQLIFKARWLGYYEEIKSDSK